MGEGVARRGPRSRYPGSCPGAWTVHSPRWTLRSNTSSELGRSLAGKVGTAQNFRKQWLRISGTHRRSIVSESRSSKESIPHCTHDFGERFIPGRTFRNNSFAAHICFPLGFRKDLIVFIRFIRNAWTNRHELFPFVERKATYLHSHHALTDPYCQQ